MALPTVTISILNYQRKELLRQALRQALSQDFPNLEVLVVDNASTDGSERMVEKDFPQVRLIRLPENIGCAARNAAMAAAKGEFVLTIDNDVLLRTRDDVRTVVEIFAQHAPSLACVNFKILDADGNLSHRDWCHPRDWRSFADQEFFTDYVLEGACAFRREAFDLAGGYWAPLFLGHEGVDLALRLLDRGNDLLYSPRIQVTHLVAAEARPSSRIYYTFVRNGIWITLRHHRPGFIPASLARDILLVGFAAARAGEWRAYVRGLGDAMKELKVALDCRQPLRPATYAKLRDIQSFEPRVWEKVRRHWSQRLI